MAGRWSSLVVVACALGAVACSGDDDGVTSTTASASSVSIDELSDAAPDSCPLPLVDAATEAGLQPVGEGTSSVETAPPNTDPTVNTLDLPPLQRLDAVSVDCTLSIDAGDVGVLLVAGRVDAAASAAFALIPFLSKQAELPIADIEPVAAGLPDDGLGDLVDLPGDAAVALVRTGVDGAADAAFLVWSDDLTRTQVEDVATNLDALLH